LYYPVNLKIADDINPINFDDVEIKFVKYKDIKEKLADEKLTQRFKFEKLNFPNYTYIQVTLRARNFKYAEDIATRYVHTILGLLAFSYQYKNTPETLIGVPKPLTEIKLTYIFVFKDSIFLMIIQNQLNSTIWKKVI
jgi:hypothetical protein